MIDSPLPPTTSSASSLSRRRLIAGGLAAGTALVTGGLLSSKGAASADAQELNSPGKALQGAERMSLRPAPDEVVPGADEVVPGADVVLPTDGKILFPMIVGPTDRAYLNDNFGACRGSGCSRSHEGTDIMADRGLPIRAVASGVLSKRYVDSGTTSGAGNGWTLLSADTDITWKFFHMDRHEDGLEEGDTVEVGQVIGYVGNTGTSGANSDSNYHLHFEYRPGNIARNSFDLLERDPNVTFY